MRIVVTGRAGQVVLSLMERGPLSGHDIVALGRPELDLARPQTVASAIADAKPDAIISAAAYTAVDKAEDEVDAAFAVNDTGAGAVAAVAAALRVPLVHLSTDYVFPGDKDAPYLETDATGPLGTYGASKLAGEQAIFAAYPSNSAVLRTAWVYSPFGNNFLKTMLRLAVDRPELGVVGDQHGNPTSALDIADGVLRVIERLATDPAPELRGLFHMTAAGETSWAGFAQMIFELSARRDGPSAAVRAITTSEYPTRAHRPGNSRLDCSKLAAVYGVQLPDWQRSTSIVVDRLVGGTA